MQGTHFDQIVVVDWSAASVPRRGRDSIWVASTDVAPGRRSTSGSVAHVRTENPPTRRSAEERLFELLDPSRRTLLAVDVSLGYPAGTAEGLGLRGEPWSAMWGLLEDLVIDDERNRNNRFEVAAALNERLSDGPGPFWGCPSATSTEALTATRPASSQHPRWRVTERELRSDGLRPFSVWQLLGAGSVGSQTMLALPVLERLRRRLGTRVDVWPFTTGLWPPVGSTEGVVVAELWPTLTTLGTRPPRGEVRDEWQVRSCAAILAGFDATRRLGSLFEVDVGDEAGSVVGEEGWVLGAARRVSRPSRCRCCG